LMIVTAAIAPLAFARNLRRFVITLFSFTWWRRLKGSGYSMT
jgi:hypothetical protein